MGSSVFFRVIAKWPHPSRQSSESPVNKSISGFPSLPSSLPNLSCIPHGRVDGREIGEIRNISPALKLLCRKPFQEIKGGMRDSFVKVSFSLHPKLGSFTFDHYIQTFVFKHFIKLVKIGQKWRGDCNYFIIHILVIKNFPNTHTQLSTNQHVSNYLTFF